MKISFAKSVNDRFKCLRLWAIPFKREHLETDVIVPSRNLFL